MSDDLDLIRMHLNPTLQYSKLFRIQYIRHVLLSIIIKLNTCDIKSKLMTIKSKMQKPDIQKDMKMDRTVANLTPD